MRQARGLHRIEAEILADGVRYHERAFLRSVEKKVRFEEIADDLTRVFHVSRSSLALCAFLAIVLASRGYALFTGDGMGWGGVLASAVCLAIAVAGTWLGSPHLVGFPSTAGGLLFFDRPGGRGAMAFLEELHEAKLTYLHERYAAPPPRSDEDDLPTSERPPGQHALN